MSRVLVPEKKEWYHQLKAVSYYGESEFERFVFSHVASFFSDFHVFPFKRDVKRRSTLVTKRPDFAMVRHDFRAWGVIEVELSEHDLKHVLEQTEVFAEGDYNAPKTASYIVRQMKKYNEIQTDLSVVEKLISTEAPEVLVIVDAPEPDWEKQLMTVPAKLCVFEVFKSIKGKFIYRAFGAYPVVPVEEAHCKRHPTIANMLEVVGGFNFINLGKQGEVDIEFESILTKWVRIEDDGKLYLRFLGRMYPLSPNNTYRLFSDRSARYFFTVN